MTKQYLCHWGILKMKWGQRKYQNSDGSWTAEGKARRRAMYKSSKSTETPTKESVQSEIDSEIERNKRLKEDRTKAYEDMRYLADMTRLKADIAQSQLNYKTTMSKLNPPKEGFIDKYITPSVNKGISSGIESGVKSAGEHYVKKILNVPDKGEKKKDQNNQNTNP